MASDGENLTGLWFEGQRYYASGLSENAAENGALAVFCRTREWLDAYFAREKPDAGSIALAPGGSEYRLTVWRLLADIPYGEVRTYGEIAALAAKELGRKGMSARAAGGAAAHNPISIIIPCHRLVGSGGAVTGYAGGTERKLALLRLEGAGG